MTRGWTGRRICMPGTTTAGSCSRTRCSSCTRTRTAGTGRSPALSPPRLPMAGFVKFFGAFRWYSSGWARSLAGSFALPRSARCGGPLPASSIAGRVGRIWPRCWRASRSSLNFVAGFASEDETVLPALRKLVSQLHAGSDRRRNSLLPSVCSGGACKRLHLYLRWMVRRDKVDPGGWDGVPAGKLIVPVDTHMHRIALAMGWTRRRRADLRAALEITRAFRAIAPADPVRYDFALTRLGIRQDTDMAAFLGRCGAPAVPRCA